MVLVNHHAPMSFCMGGHPLRSLRNARAFSLRSMGNALPGLVGQPIRRGIQAAAGNPTCCLEFGRIFIPGFSDIQQENPSSPEGSGSTELWMVPTRFACRPVPRVPKFCMEQLLEANKSSFGAQVVEGFRGFPKVLGMEQLESFLSHFFFGLRGVSQGPSGGVAAD